MKVIIASLLLVAAINSSAALKCYVCVDGVDSKCAKGGDSNMLVQECNSNFAAMSFINDEKARTLSPKQNTKAYCMAAQMDAGFGEEIFTRGCAYIFDGVDLCEYLDGVFGTSFCKSCDTDLCNLNNQ